MGDKHLRRSIIPKSAANLPKEPSYINKDVTLLDSWKVEGDSAKVFVSIRFIQYSYQCFSEWSKPEMQSFWSFSEKIHNTTWRQVLQTSGKGENKSGFGYTPINIDNYPSEAFKKNLSPDITVFELRVTQKARVHGFRNRSVFYIFWLDKDHKICA
jgi:hypothetical protein